LVRSAEGAVPDRQRPEAVDRDRTVLRVTHRSEWEPRVWFERVDAAVAEVADEERTTEAPKSCGAIASPTAH
jgi:hypothetical protein